MSRGSGLRQPLASSPGTAGRIEFVILRTGHSPPVAPHLALQRRSYVRLRAGERLPEEDFHLPDPVRFRAHECAGLPALSIDQHGSNQDESGSKPPHSTCPPCIFDLFGSNYKMHSDIHRPRNIPCGNFPAPIG